jgi:hypothetical protein
MRRKSIKSLYDIEKEKITSQEHQINEATYQTNLKSTTKDKSANYKDSAP